MQAAHANRIGGMSGTCTVLYRIHSAHSARPLADSDADYGTMFAEAEGGCGPNAQRCTWKQTVRLVSKPDIYAAQTSVKAGTNKAFGFVPLIAGAKFVREESGIDHVTRTYMLRLPKPAIRTFYRGAMPALHCPESTIIMDQVGAYDCGQDTYDIGWEITDTFDITRWRRKTR